MDMSTKKTFINYAPMLSMTDRMSDEELDAVISEYSEEANKHYNSIASERSNLEFFERNVNGLNRMKEERKRIRISKEFVLKPEHLKVLSAMRFSTGQGTIYAVLPDRDIIDSAIGIKAYDKDGDYFEEDRKKIEKIEDELYLAMNHIMKNLESFMPF